MIKRISKISLIFVLSTTCYYAQTKVFAYVKDEQGKVIEKANVDLLQSGNSILADKIGYFQFVDLQSGQYQLIVYKDGYETRVVDFTITKEDKKKDLGVIKLTPFGDNAVDGVLTIDESLSEEDGAMQPTIGLLSAGRDAFQQASAFELGSYWFRPRGIENRYEDVLFNGVSMSKNDDGRVDFSNWSGLNDITRNPIESADNITPSEYIFGNLGGYIHYNTKSSAFRRGTSLSYALTNRSYYHRLMLTHSSGMNKNGWAYTLSASRRWANGGIINGMYQDSYAYFVALEKRLSNKASVNFTAFASPTYRATNSANTQEVYDLMGKNYNAYWGWYDGEKRNSRLRKTHKPIFQLQFFNKIGENTHWDNTISYQFGKDSRSRLDWFNATDPTPTYYKNLPSFWITQAQDADSEDGYNITANEQLKIDEMTEYFKQNSLINWKNIYLQNTLNYEKGAVYTIVEDVNKDRIFNFVSHFNTKLKQNWKVNANLRYQNFISENYREVADLLGAKFAYNLNPYASNQQYDLDNPNATAKVGDKVQYHYNLLKHLYDFNVMTEVDLPKWNIMASAFVAYSENNRDGKFRNHFYVDNSKGKSEKYSSVDAGIKGKITYKINGRNFIVYNMAYFSLAPTLNDIFINPRLSDLRTPDIASQIITANDINFIHRGNKIKLRLSVFYNNINNAIDVSRYYAEGVQIGNDITPQNTFVTEILTKANKQYRGIELGVDWKITPTIVFIGAGSYGKYIYKNSPNVYLSVDNEKYARGTEFLGQSNIKNYRVAGTPQKALSLGIKYNSPKYWWVGMSLNYLADQYLDFSALNRTPNFYIDPLTGERYTAINNYDREKINIPEATQENVDKLLKQTKTDNQWMVNANAGKSFLLGKYKMGISVSVNNILGNRNYVTGGYEQGRKSNFRDAYLESTRKTPLFGSKLWYDRGTTFFTNVYFRF